MALLFLCQPRALWAQFIEPPGGSDEEYENYASELYKAYSMEFETIKHYDDFGNFMVEGLDVYKLEQSRPTETGLITKTKYYRNYFNNLIVTQDVYKTFATSIIAGDAIRTKFSSLTLDLARFNGIRWDGATRKNRFTVVASRISNPIIMPIDVTFTQASANIQQAWPRYILGGHWKTEIGDVLKLGGTYLNLSQIKSDLRSKERSFFKGDVTEAQPQVIYLRFSDDSPETGFGALIFGPPQGTLTYEEGDEKKQMALEPIPQAPVTYPLEVNGEESFDFSYNIPAELKTVAVTFTTTVANDFHISAAHEFLPNPLVPKERYTFFKTLKRAAGEVHDQSNKQKVSLNYGLDTGISIYGIDFQAYLWSFELNGEYLINTRHSKYPLLPGDRYREKNTAWYLHLKRKQGPLTLGGELFHIDPGYATSLDIYTHEANLRPYADYGDDYEPGEGDEVWGGVHDWLVDDNDDNDRYPDGWYAWPYSSVDSTSQFTELPTDTLLRYQRNSEWEDWAPDDPKPDAGIFPGLDENNDGIPDDDQNSNGILDSYEYFMMYYTDPPRFDFGDDWNNNDIIDNREDDKKPDHIYDPDLEGHHLFISLKPYRNMTLTAGRIRQQQIAQNGRNFINYGKFEYQLNFPRYGNIDLSHITKRVQDDIPDPTYQYLEGGFGRISYLRPVFVQDPLTMRNSMVHTSYLGTQFLGIPGLNVENNLKSDINRMRQTTDQEKATTEYWGGVHKTDYTFKPFSRFTISPQIKYRWEWKVKKKPNTEDSVLRHQYWFMPILRLDYELTPRTIIRAGLQGDPFFLDDKVFMHRFRNKLDALESQNARIFKVMVTQFGDYFGYKVYFNFGYEIQRISYLENEEETEDYSNVWFNIFAGW
jgi:hypothetical protein